MVHSKDPHSYHQLHNQELANWEIRVLGLKKSNRRFDKIVITVMPFDQYTEITVFTYLGNYNWWPCKQFSMEKKAQTPD